MHRLIYISQRCSSEADERDIADILARSIGNNLQLGITGALFHSAATFVQVLEGDRPSVEALFTRIRADQRHRDVMLLCDEGARNRWFGKWNMARVALSDPANRTKDGVMSQMAGDDVLSLLSTLVVGRSKTCALDTVLAARVDEVRSGIALRSRIAFDPDIRF